MSIFISIACLLDNDIVNTIRSCYEKAKYPDKVKLGICYQKDLEKLDVLKKIEDKYGERVKVIRMDWRDSQGPMFARNKIISLITDEEYFLQIDCHTRFFQDWDEILLTQYRLCLEQSEKPVISYYPINIDNMNNPEMMKNIYHIATFRQVDRNGVKTSGRVIKVPPKPLKGIGVSAAMLFTTTKVVQENPIDPNLPFALHSGEQLLYAIRLWTRGYDFFTPSQHIIATEYITNKDRVDSSYRSFLNRKAAPYHRPIWEKVKYMLGLSNTFQDTIDPIWKEGDVRSLKDYYIMSGIYKKINDIFPENRLSEV